MKVVKERNPYLKRTSSEQPHKYSYAFFHLVTISTLGSIFSSMKMGPKYLLIRMDPTLLNFAKTLLDSSHINKDMKQLKSISLPCTSLLI